jgi:hypothetical protein
MNEIEKVVGAIHKVIIIPPSKYLREWTLYIDQQSAYSRHGVVVAWYRTRSDARKHAKILRKALSV